MKTGCRNMSTIRATVAVWMIVFSTVTGAAGAFAAQHDTSFDIPLLEGGNKSSDDIFPHHRYTFLVFWDSGCPHCTESLLDCEDFLAEHSGDDIAVVAIHTDTGEMFDAQRIVDENGITFLQLWDLGGETARKYGVATGIFAVFVVDGRGNIVAGVHNPEGDLHPVLEDMLASANGKPAVAAYAQPAPGDTVAAGEPRPDAPAQFGFVLSADTRLRFFGVDSRGDVARGPYGENIRPGDNFLYRFELSISRRITRRLRVGALLRTGNEGVGVLESGPQYLGSEFGSAFAELSSGTCSLRLGYYTVAMTPLTLMRWDWNDNPRAGGTAGCNVCGATAGSLLLESLEELGPDLVFEGAIGSYRRRDLETRVFYGIPRRALDTGYIAFRSTGKDKARYSLEVAGAETRWRRFDRRTRSFLEAGLRVLHGWENHRSVNFRELLYLASDPHFKSSIVSLDGRLPVVPGIDLAGELILWNKTTVVEFTGHTANEDKNFNANGGLAGVILGLPASGRRPSIDLRGDYVHIDPGYSTPFSALSYVSNREGVRFSGLLRSAGETVALSGFYKRLREIAIDVARFGAGAGKIQDSVFGASIDVELPSGAGCSAGWMDYGSWRSGGTQPSDDTQKTLFLGARWRAHKSSILEIQYQRISVEEILRSRTENALTNLYSVYLTSSF